MNLSKRFKREELSSDDDDDIIIIEPSTSSVRTEFCQHIDRVNGENCKEYYSALCIHCNLYLCYIHVETHRQILINERDKLTNELNDRIDEVNQFVEHPEKIRQLLMEEIEIKNKVKISFSQQLSIEKLINLNQIIIQLKELFKPIQNMFQQQQCVSMLQIKKIQESFIHFDDTKKMLINSIVNSVTLEQSPCHDAFNLSNLDSPSRQYELPVQHSLHSEMAASDDLLMINDREHVLLFNLTNIFDDTLIPELIEWKTNLHGKVIDMHYNFYLKLFFILTDEKLFSYNRASSFFCLYRFTSLPWSCTTLTNSVFVLYKYSTIIEQWTFQQSSIEFKKQWKLNEILGECEHDQHLRCIRVNPSQNQLAILIEDDECRWRIAILDSNMICLHQTDVLTDASTIDWNVIFSFISDKQIIAMDATTENIYLININESSSAIEYQQRQYSDYPVNACTVTCNGYNLILRIDLSNYEVE